MKSKVTKKRIKAQYSPVFSIGYCALQALLLYEQPFAYSNGIYGWSCDYYKIDNVIISAGYSPIGIPIKYSIIKEYEKKAREIVENNSYENRKQKINLLLKRFITEVTGKDN